MTGSQIKVLGPLPTKRAVNSAVGDKPILHDYCSGEGGAAWGYKMAGFYVIGYDIKPTTRYAGDEFHVLDVRELLALAGRPPADAVHGSPPCQSYSIATAGVKRVRSRYAALIEPMREAFQRWGLPYVIENVPLAPLHDPTVLCGSMFGLETQDDDGHPLVLRRHRLFESNVALVQPKCRCVEFKRRGYSFGGVYGGGRHDRWEAKHVRHGGYTPSFDVQQRLMGIDWMTQKGLHEAIPPAYTLAIGKQLIASMAVAA